MHTLEVMTCGMLLRCWIKKPPPMLLGRGCGKELELLGFYNILMLLIPSQVYMDQEFLI
jgi:hypothetical protein